MSENITDVLRGAGSEDPRAADRLFPLIYEELRRIARSQRRRWAGNETLGTTALIHEAYARLHGQAHWASRAHFYATASKAIRHILVSYAEQRRAGKRGGGVENLPLDGVLLTTDDAVDQALDLHRALTRLEADRPRWCRVFECRFFAGLSIDETAEALEISPATVSREWQLVSAWLCDALDEAPGSP